VVFELDERYAPLLRSAGLASVGALFDVDLTPWRDIEERQNFAIDVIAADRVYRFHLKRDRYRLRHGGVLDELCGVKLLASAGLASVPVVAAGKDSEGRGALLTAELYGFTAADVRLRRGDLFESMLQITAQAAARMHRAKLQHSDLYLNHFYISEKDPSSVRLIDAARVRRGPWLFRRRRLVKDLGQFLFSTLEHGIDAETHRRWLDAWSAASGIDWVPLRPKIDERVRKIVRHDESLRRSRPLRNIRLPQGRMNERRADAVGPGVLAL
jgi:hypothetical protein